MEVGAVVRWSVASFEMGVAAEISTASLPATRCTQGWGQAVPEGQVCVRVLNDGSTRLPYTAPSRRLLTTSECYAQNSLDTCSAVCPCKVSVVYRVEVPKERTVTIANDLVASGDACTQGGETCTLLQNLALQGLNPNPKALTMRMPEDPMVQYSPGVEPLPTPLISCTTTLLGEIVACDLGCAGQCHITIRSTCPITDVCSDETENAFLYYNIDQQQAPVLDDSGQYGTIRAQWHSSSFNWPVVKNTTAPVSSFGLKVISASNGDQRGLPSSIASRRYRVLPLLDPPTITVISAETPAQVCTTDVPANRLVCRGSAQFSISSSTNQRLYYDETVNGQTASNEYRQPKLIRAFTGDASGVPEALLMKDS